MVSIKLTGFQGIKPRVSPRLIGDAIAQIAANCRLASGELLPLATPMVVATPSTPGPLLSLYRADLIWLSWDRDVDVVRSPLEASRKFIYSGYNEPRITTPELAAGLVSGDYPESARALGIPAPQTAPTVTPTGGVGATTSRFYAYTFYSDWDEESATSPLTALLTGKEDDTWAVTGMDATPSNTGTGTASHSAGVTTFTNTAAAKHWLRVGDGVILTGGEHAVVIEVTSASVFKVNGDYAAATDWAREAVWGTCTKRLYRSTGTTGQFQLVATGISGTTYDDTLDDASILGDELISGSWQPAPADLHGLVLLPSGALAGISGDEIRFSEPLQPHAWPPEYGMRAAGSTPVALGVYSSGIVVGTTGKPSVILGHEPGQMVSQPVEGAYPCLSKRSMVSMGNGAAFATTHGMIQIGDSGIQIITQDWFSRDEWDLYEPGSIVATTARGRLYLIATFDGQPQILTFDFMDQTGLTVSYVDATAMFADPLSGKLYISDRTNQDIREFDPVDGLYMSLDWMSKEFVSGNPVNLGAARVNFQAHFTPEQIAELTAIYEAAVLANEALLAAAALTDVNMLRYSDSFDVDVTSSTYGSWPLSNLAVTGVDAIEAPDGSLTADLVTATGVAGMRYLFNYGKRYADDDFSFAIRFKNGPDGFAADLQVEVYSAATEAGFWIRIDPNAGPPPTITHSGITGDGTLSASSIIDEGGGWYTATLSGNIGAPSGTPELAAGDSVVLLVRHLDHTTGSESLAAETAGQGCYLWGAQGNPGLTLDSYVRTVAAPVLVAVPDIEETIDGIDLNVHEVNGSLLMDVVPVNVEPPGVTFTLYVNGEPIFTKLVTDVRPFRLPSGYLHDTFAVRVQGQAKVVSIDLAETMLGLKDV